MRTLFLLLYNLLFPLAFLVMFPRQWLVMRRRGGYGVNWRERLARYEPPGIQAWEKSRPWWIHAVSVGEVLLAVKLIDQMRATGAWTGPVVLSVTTSTGRQLAQERTGGGVTVVWTPLDLPWVQARLHRVMRPARLVLVEAEFWPNMIEAARSREVPVQVVNARLSPRSERRFRFFRPLVAPFFKQLDLVCVPAEEDAARFAALGVQEDRLRVVGSIKYDNEGDAAIVPGEEAVAAAVASHGCLRGHRIILAASTHAGEEAVIAEAWALLRQARLDLGFVAVPRHFERAEEVVRDLRHLGLEPARRSSGSRSGDCLVVDITGELRAWCGVADVVVVGKSLPPHTGGQNPAEAVRAGKPTIVGPHMENFTTLTRSLLDAEGLRQIGDPEQLAEALAWLLDHPEEGRAMAARGQAVLQAHDGATRRTVEALRGDSQAV